MASKAKGGGIIFTSDDLTPRLHKAPEQLEKLTGMACRLYARQVESHARVNAPWRDQTGNARNGLAANAGREAEGWYIVLFHRVPYGIWLEVANEGRYQIIMPTIRHYLPLVLASLQGALARLPK